MVNDIAAVLSPQQVIKNYVTLCKLLEEPKKGGDAKKAQIKEWSRYFSYHKEGHKFVIDEIYENVLDKQDGRNLGNNSKYTKYFELLISDYLLCKENAEMILSRNEWYDALKITKLDYLSQKYKNNILVQDELMRPERLNELYELFQSKMYSIFEASLKSLDRRGIIIVEEAFRIVEHDMKFGEFRYATLQECKYIREAEKEALALLAHEDDSLKNRYAIKRKGQEDKFYEYRNNILIDWDCKWKSAYQSIGITLETDRIDLKTNSINTDEIEDARRQLKELIYKAVGKRIDKKYGRCNVSIDNGQEFDFYDLLDDLCEEVFGKREDNYYTMKRDMEKSENSFYLEQEKRIIAGFLDYEEELAVAC